MFLCVSEATKSKRNTPTWQKKTPLSLYVSLNSFSIRAYLLPPHNIILKNRLFQECSLKMCIYIFYEAKLSITLERENLSIIGLKHIQWFLEHEAKFMLSY